MRYAAQSVLVLLLFSSNLVLAQEEKYTLKVAETAIPKDLDKSIQDSLSKKSIQFLDGKGKMVGEIWLRKQISSEELAVANKKKDLKYRDLKETVLFGVIRLDQGWTDYRKQKINPGLYTIRLGFQPQDGDHMGTSPYPEFCLLIAAKFDPKLGTMDPRGMIERSAASINTSHPAVFLLFPPEKLPNTPQIVNLPRNQVGLDTSTQVEVGDGNMVPLPIRLILVGHATE